MTIMEKVNEGIKDAMRNKDSLRLGTLRMLKSKILAVDARGILPDVEVQKLFKAYLGNVQEELEQSQSINRTDHVEKLKLEINIIQEFLPKALSIEETKKIVAQAIQDSGAQSKKDIGLVMKLIRSINSNIDGKIAKDIVDEMLNESEK